MAMIWGPNSLLLVAIGRKRTGMQVSCESCGARYELDDSRFSGRGARCITCPRCQHVFVAYREDSGEGDSSEADSSEAETATATEQKTYHVDDLDFRKVGIQA